MIEIFKNFNLKAIRRSIAGDQVRSDLKSLVFNCFGIDINNTTIEEKTLIRDLMVHYGRTQRKLTNGRYFIDKFEPSEAIDIVPDIRYDEYEKDELFWIKNEVKGFLIFLERDGIEPANIYEEENNKKIKENADLIIKWPTFTSEELNVEILKYAKDAICNWFKFVKI